MKPKTQDQPSAPKSSPASPLSAPPACSSALAALYEQYDAAIEAWFHGEMFEGEKERLMEVARLHAAIKAERSRSQCLMNSVISNTPTGLSPNE